MTLDYKNTIFLPQTGFPLRAGLPQKEPEILALWQQLDLGKKLMAANEGAEPFVLHDGPPYANGNIHLGHALNKILKDVINRTFRMKGRHVHYVPGWDCHGLPIEWKIEQEYRAKGKNKDEVPVLDLIKDCRAFAGQWIETQKAEFKRLGVDGDWDNPYTTMAKEAEATIVKEIHTFLMQDRLYRADRPVMWSVVEKTALAEAEVEYHDHKSITAFARFPVKSSPLPQLAGTSIVIWTTTPWTLPANQAIAYGDELEYGIYVVKAVGEGSLAIVGEKIVIATTLAESVSKAAKIEALELLEKVSGRSLAGTIALHPLHEQGFAEDRRLLAGKFVTADAGTGFVHIAPSHGEDDYRLGKEYGLPAKQFVGPDGAYYPTVPLFAGEKVLTEDGKEGTANVSVLRALIAAKGLLAKGSLTHSYPHSWRSKAPIIFRSTSQWFVALDQPATGQAGTMRENALKAIDDTRWVPEQGRNRIYSMIEGRPDWCLSRQRTWGVPIALFINKATSEPLHDTSVNERIQKAFREEGIEAWHSRPPQDFLGNAYKADDYEQVLDICDVWFDSGTSHSFVLDQRPYLRWPADLYLEGSDQHRGWFHTSLLTGVGLKGRAPFNSVLTHGFVLDEKGYKMSKSVGNVVAPQDVMSEYGADILRLMLMNADYKADIRIGPNILKQSADFYRRIRNTLRYLLGALDGFSPAERLPHKDLPELERWVLHGLATTAKKLEEDIENYNFHSYFRTVHDFCANELSAFYFDIRKDSLYCDATTSPTRRATRTVMEQVFLALTAWLAPILCFTAEEAWQEWRTKQGGEDSVHLRHLPKFPAEWQDDALADKWAKIRSVRSALTGALEKAREAKVIGSSLQAAPTLHLTDASLAALFTPEMVAELAITSSAIISTSPAPADAFVSPEGIGVVVRTAEGAKCERCWKVLPEVGKSTAHPGLCLRCEAVVAAQPQGAAA